MRKTELLTIKHQSAIHKNHLPQSLCETNRLLITLPQGAERQPHIDVSQLRKCPGFMNQEFTVLLSILGVQSIWQQRKMQPILLYNLLVNLLKFQKVRI